MVLDLDSCRILPKKAESIYIDMIEFMIKEAERLEREYPNESFDQGPALAVQELAVRFLN